MTLSHFALLDALQHAVICTDTRGRITDWNASAEALYGWRREEVLGRDILEVTPTDLSRETATDIMQTLRAGDVWSGDFRVRRRGGEEFLASVTDVPMLDDAQKLTGIVGISAPAGTHTPLPVIVERFAAACERLWPGRVTFDYALAPDVRLAASDPYLIQLIALLLIRQAPAMSRGSRAEIAMRPTGPGEFAEFVRVPSAAVYMKFAWSDDAMLDTPLDRFISTTARMPFIAKLIAMAGGIVLRGFDQTHWRKIHLILPL